MDPAMGGFESNQGDHAMTDRTNAQDQFDISSLLERVRRMARAIARGLPSNLQVDDLVSAGNLGVAVALSRFSGDPATFEIFAMTHARGAMLDELRRLDTMSRPARRLARRAASITSTLAARLGRQPAEEEIAAEMNLDLDTYREMVLQRATTLVDGSHVDGIMDTAVPADQQLDRRRTQLRLSGEIARLPQRHATVLELSFHEDQTLQSIAGTLGVSVARVHQIRNAALGVLRRTCAEDALDAVA
jgi:RNA polymerase sigma factor for flagellar operon FliA